MVYRERSLFINNIDATDFNFNIYPNPADDRIYLNISNKSNYKFLLTDLQGKTILRNKIYSDKNFIDVSNIQNGFYMLTILTEKNKFTWKVVIQH